MELPKINENVKFWIFYGAAMLWIAWGVVDYFFSFAFQIFLGLMILVLGVWISVVCRTTKLIK